MGCGASKHDIKVVAGSGDQPHIAPSTGVSAAVTKRAGIANLPTAALSSRTTLDLLLSVGALDPIVQAVDTVLSANAGSGGDALKTLQEVPELSLSLSIHSAVPSLVKKIKGQVAGRTEGPQQTPASPREASVASTHEGSTGIVEAVEAVGGAQATLDLSKGALADVPDHDIRGVVESKGKSGVKSAACVDLSRNKLGPRIVLALEAVFSGRDLRNLSTINLSNNYLRKKGAQNLSILSDLPSLTDLNLEENCLSDDGAAALSSLKGCISLRVLNLEANGLKGDGVAALESISGMDSLSELSLGYNSIGPDGVAKLAWLPKGLPSLKVLGLRYNRVGSRGVEGLGSIAGGGDDGGKSKIQKIDLEGNALGPAGASNLRVLAGLSSTLTELDVSNNGLASAGASALACLQPLCNLTAIKLSDNQFCPEGVENLAKALQGMSSIRVMRLEGNQMMGADAAASLSNALPSVNSIVLSSSGNRN